MVSLSFLVPTAGRQELRTCLSSIAFQLGPDDEVIVVGDTCDGPLPETERLVHSFGSQFRYLEHNDGRHSWGHDQLNVGMAAARGDWLSFNDDDDVWVPGAVKIIRSACVERPVLFRFMNYHGFPCWVERGLFMRDYVGGHNLVCPNIPEKLGEWGFSYTGDWDFVEGTVALHGGPDKLIWRAEVIVIARPSHDIVAEVMRLAYGQELVHA